MKKILVTDGLASLIDRLHSDDGLNERKALIADAMSASVKQYEQLECYDAESFLPLTAISMYRDLIDELARCEVKKKHWL